MIVIGLQISVIFSLSIRVLAVVIFPSLPSLSLRLFFPLESSAIVDSMEYGFSSMFLQAKITLIYRNCISVLRGSVEDRQKIIEKMLERAITTSGRALCPT